jgi:hypothetical protein
VTTIFEEDVTCAVCGNEQKVTELGSTSSFGSMDLDTRPPELQRSTIGMWLHECKGCGFVSSELGESKPTDLEMVATSGYRATLMSRDRHHGANRFVCRSMLDEAAGELASAGWRRLHAAWVCDDEQDVEAAQILRREAVMLFERARAAGTLAMAKVVGGDELLLADLSRRSGEFAQGITYCEAGLRHGEITPFVSDLLKFERGLCEARDTKCHTVGEIEEGEEDDEEPRGTVH